MNNLNKFAFNFKGFRCLMLSWPFHINFWRYLQYWVLWRHFFVLYFCFVSQCMYWLLVDWVYFNWEHFCWRFIILGYVIWVFVWFLEDSLIWLRYLGYWVFFFIWFFWLIDPNENMLSSITLLFYWMFLIFLMSIKKINIKCINIKLAW